MIYNPVAGSKKAKKRRNLLNRQIYPLISFVTPTMGKELVQYSVVDAFTDRPFKGNPAAVCLLEEERDDEWLQCVAAEFNISETSYLIPVHDAPSPVPRFQLRWFTPVAEVELCGHATLAAAHSLFTSGEVDSDTIEFITLSGTLTAKRVSQVKRSNNSNVQNNGIEKEYLIELDFPAIQTFECHSDELPLILRALNGAPAIEVKKTASDDLLVVLSSGEEVENFQPQLEAIGKCPGRGLVITGASSCSNFDFFSRFFCPKLGINEDPVCGSAHCALATYWNKKLGKNDFIAFQASPRSGILQVQLDEEEQRVRLQGKAVTVMRGCLLA